MLCQKILKKNASRNDASRHMEFLTKPTSLSNPCKLSSTSHCFRFHVLRASAQCYIWKNALSQQIENLDYCSFGYYNGEEGKLCPILMTQEATPPDLIRPCKCKKCARTSCLCRFANIPCCNFCQCTKNDCQNPQNQHDCGIWRVYVQLCCKNFVKGKGFIWHSIIFLNYMIVDNLRNCSATEV